MKTGRPSTVRLGPHRSYGEPVISSRLGISGRRRGGIRRQSTHSLAPTQAPGEFFHRRGLGWGGVVDTTTSRREDDTRATRVACLSRGRPVEVGNREEGIFPGKGGQ